MGKRILGIKKASDRVMRCAHPRLMGIIRGDCTVYRCMDCGAAVSRAEALISPDAPMLLREVAEVPQFQSMN